MIAFLSDVNEPWLVFGERRKTGVRFPSRIKYSGIVFFCQDLTHFFEEKILQRKKLVIFARSRKDDEFCLEGVLVVY